jgi:uncharacterized protein (TIGR03000 family)
MLTVLLTTAALTGVPNQSGTAPGTLVVSLPSDATLYVDGKPTTSTGSVRRLQTPPGSTGSYTLRALVTRDGEVVSQEKVVQVRGGREAKVRFDFSSQASTLRGGSGGFNPGPGGSGGGGAVVPGGGGSVGPGPSGGDSVLPPTPGGGKIVQKKVIDPKTGKLITQKYLVRPDGSKVLLSGNPVGAPYSGTKSKATNPKGSRPKGSSSSGSGSSGSSSTSTSSYRPSGQSYRPSGTSSYRPSGSSSYRPSGGSSYRPSGGGRGPR